ncbi:hypothetical protein R1sor_000996 [Riccia sorocarpa]|uniref:Uncharacterized protein n=1 Tax=Riccia sorocarpa TaxID=122646 RepID=A0ABD3GYP3_9MARC
MPFNTQASQDPSKGTHGQSNEERTNGNLMAALGGQENLMSLMTMFSTMNRKVMEDSTSGIGKQIDDKLVAAVPTSQYSAAGVSATPVREAAAVGISKGSSFLKASHENSTLAVGMIQVDGDIFSLQWLEVESFEDEDEIPADKEKLIVVGKVISSNPSGPSQDHKKKKKKKKKKRVPESQFTSPKRSSL